MLLDIFDKETTNNTENVAVWNAQNTQSNTEEPLVPVKWNSVGESTTELNNKCLHDSSENENDNEHP